MALFINALAFPVADFATMEAAGKIGTLAGPLVSVAPGVTVLLAASRRYDHEKACRADCVQAINSLEFVEADRQLTEHILDGLAGPEPSWPATDGTRRKDPRGARRMPGLHARAV